MLPFFGKGKGIMRGREQSDEQAQREEIAGWREGLDALHARIAGRFARAEVRARVRRYLAGLLGRVERKNGWQVAEALGESGPQGVQRLLNAAAWDTDAVRDDLRAYVVEHLGAADGVLVIDETGFLKKGTKSVGVKRQYSGTAGRIENCQIGVFLAYASARGHAFLDRELYLPQEWATDQGRRAEAGVPAAIAFATKSRLAQAMLARAFTAGVPVAWVTGDAVYGDDGRLRRWLEEQRRPYVLAVSCSHIVRRGSQQRRVDALIAAVPADAWQRLSAGEGSQGPRWYDWTWVPLPAASQPAMSQWVLARRSVSDPREVAYYRAFGPAATPVTEVVRVAGTRWAIEESFERAKETVGLDQYEVRRWTAWYRHITLALLAHAYLEVTRTRAAPHPLTARPSQEGAKKGAARSLRSRSRSPRSGGSCSPWTTRRSALACGWRGHDGDVTIKPWPSGGMPPGAPSATLQLPVRFCRPCSLCETRMRSRAPRRRTSPTSSGASSCRCSPPRAAERASPHAICG
jgi:SRSO17 transposase